MFVDAQVYLFFDNANFPSLILQSKSCDEQLLSYECLADRPSWARVLRLLPTFSQSHKADCLERRNVLSAPGHDQVASQQPMRRGLARSKTIVAFKGLNLSVRLLLTYSNKETCSAVIDAGLLPGRRTSCTSSVCLARCL